LRSPKYDWLLQWLYSATLVKQNVAKRKRREVQAVPAEMQTRNALYVVDVGKSVTMAKTRAPNGRMQRDYLIVYLTVTDQKFSSRR